MEAVLAVTLSHFTRGELLNLHLGTQLDVKQFELFKALFILLSWASEHPKSTLSKLLQWPPPGKDQTSGGGLAPRHPWAKAHPGGQLRATSASRSLPEAPRPAGCSPPGSPASAQPLRAAQRHFLTNCPSSHAAEIRNKNNPGPAPWPPSGVTGHKPGTPPGQRSADRRSGSTPWSPLLPLPPSSRPPEPRGHAAGPQRDPSPPLSALPAADARRPLGAHGAPEPRQPPPGPARPSPAPYRCAGRSRRHRRKPRTAAEGGPPGGAGPPAARARAVMAANGRGAEGSGGSTPHRHTQGFAVGGLRARAWL